MCQETGPRVAKVTPLRVVEEPKTSQSAADAKAKPRKVKSKSLSEDASDFVPNTGSRKVKPIIFLLINFFKI